MKAADFKPQSNFSETAMLQQTSLLAYENEIRTRLSEKCMEVYSIIYQHGPIDNKAIAELLHWPINCVTGRTRDLVKKFDMVEEALKGTDANTGRLVIFWRVK